ncbi:thiamine diphosphokinase [Lacticaseibacillus zhaodongensis]|uniref:thiamine diphosphokinase n=1 Tax=Lacticaseibacillus zhaodongensis TaxID=2668065 RepID=UPI0012D2B03D|nr:thiamine diphosphokinase [Lacticaseibacillus zhaodongensis]
MSRRINLMVGGPTANLPADWQQAPGEWAAADRGTLELERAGINMLFSVGDYDSLTENEFAQLYEAGLTGEQFPSEKDYTDTQLAARAAFVHYGADELYIYAATGGRLDHELANILLPTDKMFRAYTERIHLVDRVNLFDYLTPGTHTIAANANYPYFGVIPLTAVDDLNISGAKYPLAHWSTAVPFSWASNEFLGGQPASVCFASGVVAINYSRDYRGQTKDN